MREITDIMVELYFADNDPAYMEEQDDRKEKLAKRTMKKLFEKLERVMNSFDDDELDIIVEYKDEALEMFEEIIEG